MTYVDVGSGSPIVFLHGNPTSSFLWRNILPHLEPFGRLIAPDFPGMGGSAKLPETQPDRYTYLDHANRVFQLLEKLGVKKDVTFVVHDWGGPLAFLWAFQRRFDPRAVKGIVLMEAILEPLPEIPNELSFLATVRGEMGEQIVLEENVFVEFVLPSGILRNLTKREMDMYREPYLNPGEDRRPLLTLAREIPIGGEPMIPDMFLRVTAEWMAENNLPKLWINANPGLIIVGELREVVRGWRNLKETTVDGIHFIQEDSPDEIGTAIADWIKTL